MLMAFAEQWYATDTEEEEYGGWRRKVEKERRLGIYGGSHCCCFVWMDVWRAPEVEDVSSGIP
jgi:hypothetical protein